jgi:hypothetical protein
MRWAWMSRCRHTGACIRGNQIAPRAWPAPTVGVVSSSGPWPRLARSVVRRFLGDRDVVHVALAHAGAGDAHELRPRAHLVDVVAAGVAHRRAQAAGELVHDGDDLPL